MGTRLMHAVLSSLMDVQTLEKGQKLDAPSLLLLLCLAFKNVDDFNGRDGWWGIQEKLAGWARVKGRKLALTKAVLVENGLLTYDSKPTLCFNHLKKVFEYRKNVYKVNYAKIKEMKPPSGSAPRAEQPCTTCTATLHHMQGNPAPRADNRIIDIDTNNNNNNRENAGGCADVQARQIHALITQELGFDTSVLGLSSIRKKIVGKDIGEVCKIVHKTAEKLRDNPQKDDKERKEQIIGWMFSRCEALPPATAPSATDPALWVKPAPEPAAEPPRNPVDDLWARLVKSYSLTDADAAALKGKFYEVFEEVYKISPTMCNGQFKQLLEDDVPPPCDNPRKSLLKAFDTIEKRT